MAIEIYLPLALTTICGLILWVMFVRKGKK